MFFGEHYYLCNILKIQHSNTMPCPIDEKPFLTCVTLTRTMISVNKSDADNLSITCYQQVHGLFAELSITDTRPTGVDSRGICQQLSTGH